MLVWSTRSAAQQPQPAAVGDRVRVTRTDRDRVVGTLDSLAADSIRILTTRTVAAPDRPSTEVRIRRVPVSIPRRSVLRIERRVREDRTLGAVRGAAVGVGLVGLLIGYQYVRGGEEAAFGAQLTAIWGFPLAVVAGGLAGSFVPVERWRPARLP